MTMVWSTGLPARLSVKALMERLEAKTNFNSTDSTDCQAFSSKNLALNLT
ncbi:MAG: hypothetical protein JGK26_03995 [Microcoleus sp. PH2017_27_LUM_O_A]|nr:MULTISPECIES: hypothetical protein [unclassified Microcoleus]MCC3458856.1 hypothetical protein [Microcoleus sp. PH2017_11_PCY_U_A]MCC3558292.1 hypothetical protein [Microcoleus sp. PH2017_27_LUM_O_A]